MKKRTVIRGMNLSLIFFVSLLVWVVLLILHQLQIQDIATPSQWLNYLGSPGILFVLNYLNAIVLTILAVMFFAYLFRLSREKNRFLAVVGILFIPVYAVLNLFAYGSQLSVLPVLLRNAEELAGNPAVFYFLTQFIQLNPNSLVGVINAFAYAVLAIPSICFGLILLKQSNWGLVAAVLLFINAAACVLGFIGIAAALEALSLGTLLGGFFFTAAVFFVYLLFREKHEANKRDR